MKVSSRFVFKIMVMLAFVIYAFAADAQEERNDPYTKLFPGQSELKVKELLGIPSRIEAFKTVPYGTQDTLTYWFYSAKNWTIVFRNHYLETIEKDRHALLQRVQDWANPKNKEGLKLIYDK